ncbi:MAG: 1-acyl-sn-glycerol-3-phosphate acyltransferase [Pseudomonadota bacterium]
MAANTNDDLHIIDQMLTERAPRLLRSRWWPLLGPLRDAFFGYHKARRMADAIAPLGGQEALDYISELLGLEVLAEGLHHLPPSGACVVVCNHPTGIADGIAVFDALKQVRGDLRFLANADAQRICPRFDDVLIPVVWPPAKRNVRSTKVALRMARAALQQQKALVIFAAGLMSKHIDGRLQDPPWEHSAVALARKHAVPLVPLHVAGPYSLLFHLFHRLSQELRDITLFHEFMNKAGRRFTLRLGPTIDVTALEQTTNEALTVSLKHYVERVLPEELDLPFLDSPSYVPIDRKKLC